MRRAGLACISLLLVAADPAVDPAADPWRVPPEGACKTEPPRLPAWLADADDAPPLTPPAPGDVIGYERAAVLQTFLPPEIWEHRERFFFPGMQMVIGPCYRDYSPPGFFQRASEELSPQVRLTAEGRLEGHRAGLAFPRERIDPNDERAALKWAWSRSTRYRAAGSFGGHLLSIVSDRGVADQWRGDHFFAALAGRSDRPGDGWRYPSKIEASWAAGGSTKNLRTGNRCVFRQYGHSDRRPDYFVGSSYTRKMRREPPPGDGAISACLVDAAIGAGLFVHGGENPHLHRWKIRHVIDLLAPINARKDTWPLEKQRSYGPWGISFADDRWELRRVLVLEGTLREGAYEDGTRSFVWYLDLQTLTPLYYAAYRDEDEVAGIGYFVSRWSEDRLDYPRWPDDPERPMRKLDEIGAAFVDWNDQHAVRIESGDDVGVPESDRKLMRKLSVGSARPR